MQILQGASIHDIHYSRRSSSTYDSELGRGVNEHGGEEKDKNVQRFRHQTQVKEGLPTVPWEREDKEELLCINLQFSR